MTGGWDQATWKRVESEDELRAGMTVQLRPCGFCRLWERIVLLASRPAAPMEIDGNGEISPTGARYAWNQIGFCDDGHPVFGKSISEGRLFALVDTAPAEETTTTTRELEKVTG